MVRVATVWKGALNFGLVNINVELYSAIKAHSLGFNLLHSKCHTPINYKRWCPRCSQDVEWEEIVKGLKLDNGSYFIISKQTLDKLKPEKSDYINIVEFVNVNQLSPLYFDQHYYVAPSRETDKAFFLFNAALDDVNKIAIGQFVLRDKQYVCAIQPYNNALLLTTLNYSYEIRHVKKIEDLKKPKIEKEELKLAEQLIARLTHKKFDMTKYKDNFAEQLMNAIKNAQKGKKLPAGKKVTKKIKNTKEPSLIKALQASLKSNSRSEARAKGR